MVRTLVAGFLALLPAIALGQDASLAGKVTLREKQGDALVARSAHDGAIVYVVGFEQPAPRDTVTIKQEGKTFVPAATVATVGQAVDFVNYDAVFHNIFSQQPKFDLGQYKDDKPRTRKFEKPGVVTVYCNIHPEMVGWVLIVPNRAHAATAADGSFKIGGIPPGKHTVVVWHPRAKPVTQEVEFVAGKTATFDTNLDATVALEPHKNKFGVAYTKSAW